MHNGGRLKLYVLSKPICCSQIDRTDVSIARNKKHYLITYTCKIPCTENVVEQRPQTSETVHWKRVGTLQPPGHLANIPPAESTCNQLTIDVDV